MQPKIIKCGKMQITGLTGDGNKTSAVWNEFDSRYKEKPFPKIDENGYEIRFFNKEKEGRDVHVGFSVEPGREIAGFDVIVIPASEYAVFEVLVANGYDSGNAKMDKWLADNSNRLKCGEIDGAGFIMEVYGEKFKGGNQPDSIVEFWVPLIYH